MTGEPEGLLPLLERAGARWPERVGLVQEGRSWTYGELLRRVRSLSAALRARGVGSGDRIAALCGNTLELYELYFAAPALGAALVPLNLRLSAPELAAVLRDAEPRALVVSSEHAELARAASQGLELARVHVGGGEGEAYAALLDTDAAGFAPAPPDLEALAQLYYTSGTTGRAKGVMLTQRNVLRHAEAAAAELSLTPDDRWGHFAPMFHLADAWATFAVTLAGGRHVMQPAFDARDALETIAGEGVTLTNLVPTMLARMVHEEESAPRELSSLRLVLSGGAPIAPQLVRRTMAAFGCEYAQTYGLTETSPYLTLSLLEGDLRALPPDEQLRYRAKTGRAFAAVELRVVDDAGREVPADGRAVGEVRARGETVTPGYWNRPEETAAAFEGGWLLTGDLATIDARGFLEIVDRKKDVILTGGETVYSTEVEHALCEHPAVLECAAFARPDAEWGERVCAAVVPKPGAAVTPEELVEHCRALLGAYKLPRALELMDELPKTGSGKVRKRLLRERGA